MVKNFRADPHSLGTAGGLEGHDHEFLDIDIVIGMGAAIENIHHRHRQQLGVGAANVTIKRQTALIRRRTGHGQGNAQNGVGPQTPLVLGTIDVDHLLIHRHLIKHLHADHGIGQFAVDGIHRLGDALAQITALVAITQFHRLTGAGGSPGWHRSTAQTALFGKDLHLHGGIATGIEDFTRLNMGNAAHGL